MTESVHGNIMTNIDTTPAPYEASVLADSVPANGGPRLTTLVVTIPRIVLAEFNTHRMFCLAGDCELEFDLPGGNRKKSHKKVYKMKLSEFVDKWKNGANRVKSNPKTNFDISWIQPKEYYLSSFTAQKMGMKNASNINSFCRSGKLKAKKHSNGKSWLVQGQSILDWRSEVPDNTRFDIKDRLSNMRIRQLNEETGDIQWSTVKNVFESGKKEVWELRAGDFVVAGSKDHRVLTDSGWKTISEITFDDFIVVRKFGKKEEEKLDELRLKKIGGRWRSVWQRKMRDKMVSLDPLCRSCHQKPGKEVHHIVPVYQDPSRCFDQSNITLLCESCHNEQHESQGWQGGTYLYGALEKVSSKSLRGVEETYDLEIDGEFPNFLANGVVVHNSRNSASSRAIPVKKKIKMIEENPFVPLSFGKNQRGMSAEEDLGEAASIEAENAWMEARDHAIEAAKKLADIGVHKQLANRITEPFSWQTIICTATEWDNYFALRISEHAQPEIMRASVAMKKAMDESEPEELFPGEWHLPLVFEDDVEEAESRFEARFQQDNFLVKLSCARCARVSYLTHDGKRSTDKDIELYDRLVSAGHMSPLEHSAMVGTVFTTRGADSDYLHRKGMFYEGFVGNFRTPWIQHRKMIPGEFVFQEKSV